MSAADPPNGQTPSLDESQRTRALLEGIARSTGDLIAAEDHDFRYLFFNEAYAAEFERLWGHTIEVGMSMAEALAPWPEQQAKACELWGRALAGESFTVTEDFGPTEQERQVYELHFSPVQGRDGTIIGASHILRNVTDRVRAEEELRRLAAELAETDRRKTDFLATLSHELRNPLAPIRTGLDVMRIALAEGDLATVADTREVMERQTLRLATLVDDLLHISRISRGKIELRPEPLILEEAIDRAVEEMRPTFAEWKHELTVTRDEKPIVVNGDTHRLVQVFSNLLHNAAEHTPAGGHISVTTTREGEHVRVTVADDGVGIPPDELEAIFGMFHQIDDGSHLSRGGLGIGLTLASSLVEMHGGRVEARSDGPGTGAAFDVWLPVADGPAARAEPSPHDHGPNGSQTPDGTRSVLIVDDNRDAAILLDQMIRRMGNETHLACDGAQALEVADRVRPDVILMDLGMPNLDGLEAARRIRQRPWGRNVTLVALTGWGQERDRQRTEQAGFDYHLVKPTDSAALRQVLDDADSADDD